jgi:dienelactone hydrolase
MTRHASFELQAHLDHLYEHRAQPPGDRAELRRRLVALLGLMGRQPVEVSAELASIEDRGVYREERLSLDVGEGVHAPLAVLVPGGKPPFTPIIAFHGHEPGMEYILGHYPDVEVARDYLSRDNNYAQALAEAGYLVCAVEQRGMGARLTGQTDANSPFPRSCRHLSTAYGMLGRTLIGERCGDAICAIDYLKSRPDVVNDKLGVTGHSGGGCTALWLAAIDERVTAAVVSAYFCSFRDSILAMPHCECNTVPGMLTLGEMGDLASLVAPRPLCILHGKTDPIFPGAGTRAQFETLHRAYASIGRADACTLSVHPGGHVYDHARSLAWFRAWL